MKFTDCPTCCERCGQPSAQGNREAVAVLRRSGRGMRGCARVVWVHCTRRAGGGRAARWAPISSGEPRAAALHLYDNYFLFVFVEESTRLADRRFSEPSSIVVN